MSNISGRIECGDYGHAWIWGGTGEYEMPDWLHCQCGKKTYGDRRRQDARMLLSREIMLLVVLGFVLGAVVGSSLIALVG